VSDLDPKQVVASFDSASVLHAAAAAALEGQPFRNLGSSALAGLAVRAAGRLPWSVLRGIYTRIGASEGINPRRLGDVDLAGVAASFAERYPKRRYAAILLGASNGALMHLGAAMQVPWLPDTVLVHERISMDLIPSAFPTTSAHSVATAEYLLNCHGPENHGVR
jgi:hypothetical protein